MVGGPMQAFPYEKKNLDLQKWSLRFGVALSLMHYHIDKQKFQVITLLFLLECTEKKNEHERAK